MKMSLFLVAAAASVALVAGAPHLVKPTATQSMTECSLACTSAYQTCYGSWEGCAATYKNCLSACTPGSVVAMPRDCQEACHADEYDKVSACGQSGDCVQAVESAIAECDAACLNNPTVTAPAPAQVGGVACVAACKLASKVAEAACKFQKPSHRARCKENVAKVETDCEAACVLIPTVKVATEVTTEVTTTKPINPIQKPHASVGAPAFALAESEYQKHFTSFVQKHGKKYTRDEFFPRYSIFKANLNKIHAHNAKGLSYSMAVNEFADMTFTEFHAKMTGYKRRDKSADKIAATFNRTSVGPHTMLGRAQLASSLDWRQKGAVTPVKNQQSCGSCYTFSASGATEGAWAIRTGRLLSLSEQQIVDCSGSFGNHGCTGGMMDAAFQYIIANGGITTEAAYPYTAHVGYCKSVTSSVAATLSGFIDVSPNNEYALMAAVNVGPVSVALEASQQVFQFYSGGVLRDPACGTALDHGVLIVGYGTDRREGDYWIVKNSWGDSWGENGYIRIARGSNECGIATEPSYPVV